MAEKIVDCSSLQVGKEYYRDYLAELWGYNGTKGLEKGIVPAANNVFVLFTTREKARDAVQYEDSFTDGILIIDGQKKHRTDNAILTSGTVFYSFFREKNKSGGKGAPFTYQGEAVLLRDKCIIRQIGEAPSKFCFKIKSMTKNDSFINEILDKLHGDTGSLSEGAKRYITHVSYERNKKLRQKALLIHPHRCIVCGFNFDDFYGGDCSDGYIEIHHIKPISEAGIREVDPANDLVPVCANCHRMIHHHRDEIMTIEELKRKISRNKRKCHMTV